uniref:arginine kinase n=1 Tax=Trichuris muris TaxID=70415 RepID=A0A5S6QJ90_TRIMR
MDWMYAGPSSEIDRENYLTGRKVDKNFEQYNEDFKEAPSKIESLSLPVSSRCAGAVASKRTLLDLDTVRKEDPLVSIKVQEEQVRRDILENPMKMKCLRKIVMKAMRRKMKKMYKGRLTPEERMECARFFHLIDQIATGQTTGMENSSNSTQSFANEGIGSKHERRKNVRRHEEDGQNVSKPDEMARYSKRASVRSSHTGFDHSRLPKDYQKDSRHSTDSSKKRSLTSVEKERLLNEMVQNASWRKEQRDRKLTKLAAHEKDELSNEMGATSDVQRTCEICFEQLQRAEECQSLLKKCLTKAALDEMKSRKTSMNATLLDVIQSGVKNLDSGVGVYAPDAESYVVFKELFDPILEKYHQFGPNSCQPATDLGSNKLDQLCTTLSGYPFNPLLTEANYLEIENKVKNALSALTEEDLRGTYYPLKGMTAEVQQTLINDHFLFKEGDRFLQAANACRFWPLGRGIFHNKDKTFLIWVNEEDHLRIISMEAGGNVRSVLDRLIRGLNALGHMLTFARDERLGWLSFCPTNLGTTVRASVHIRLPMMSARTDFKEICGKMNLQVRGIHGEHSESEGGIYDISNRRRMGLTEFDAVKEMYDGINELIKMEKDMENGS